MLNDTHCLIRTQIKIWGNFPQIHADRHNMKKLSSDPPESRRIARKNLPIHLIWDRFEEKFSLSNELWILWE